MLVVWLVKKWLVSCGGGLLQRGSDATPGEQEQEQEKEEEEEED